MPQSDEERKRKNKLERIRKWAKENPEKVREAKKKYAKKNPEKVREAKKKYEEKNREELRKKRKEFREKHPKKIKERNKKYRKNNHEEIIKRERKHREDNREEVRAYGRKWQKENPEKVKGILNKWREANHEKLIAWSRRYKKEHPDKDKENYQKNKLERIRKSKKWAEKNPELVKSYKKIYQKKNPPAQLPSMTEYKRTHRKCEWEKPFHAGTLHCHHILSKHKYPRYMDGNYHGRIANNFICYCSFHHFVYHNAYAIRRNDKKHEKSHRLLWGQVLQWADSKKISIDDLVDEAKRLN